MTDVHSKQTRSYNMSQIKGKNTKPEIMIRKFLFSNGFRYRLHDKKLPGKPDIVLAKYRTVIFINGCFWHGHEGCKDFVVPKTNTDWWIIKLNRNKELDIKNSNRLLTLGWNVITIFECELNKQNLGLKLANVVSIIKNGNTNS
jgi:DNA mismatch endonuclease (patch repair protein)